MKIVISGAGEVGSHLAKLLSATKHDITIIDQDHKLLDNVASAADVVSVEGDPSEFGVLKRAAIRKTDLFIAVTPDENLNVVSAMIAKRLGARKCLVRVDHSEYLEPQNKEVFTEMGIDFMFYPERVAAHEVVTLLGHTSMTEYVDFADGKLALAVFRLDSSSPMIGRRLMDITPTRNDLVYRTVAITRADVTVIPHGDDVFSEGDMLYVITGRETKTEVMRFSGQHNVQIRSLMILGGSRIGTLVAKALEGEMEVKLVEYNSNKAYRLAEILDKTLIINEDGRNIEAMEEEGLRTMDAFVAVTGRSETNILAAMVAKRMGVKKVIAEVENMSYIPLAESIGVDTIINKKLVTASSIFRFTMSTDVQVVKYLTGSQAEVLEFIAKPGSPVTKSALRDMEFPREAIVGGVVRGDKAFIATGDTEVMAYDRVVVFALPDVVDKVGKFFN